MRKTLESTATFGNAIGGTSTGRDWWSPRGQPSSRDVGQSVGLTIWGAFPVEGATLRKFELDLLPKCNYIVITMRTQLVRIGNSRGVRLPKTVIDQVGLTDEIDLRVENRCVVIAPLRPCRSGWADAAQRLRAETKGLLDASVPTRFDEDDWRW